METRMAIAVSCILAGCLTSLAGHARNRTDPVVVTATRFPLSADETLSSVTVITRDEIERSQANSVGEVLRGVTGVDVTNQGGYGKLTSVFMRGTNSGNVTVLVDGVRMGSATTGTVSWEFLPLSQIERIEVVRGPNSALYGSDAIGGVIQIFTKKGEGPMRYGFSAGGGRYGTYEAAADVSGSTGNDWYSLKLSRFQTNGFDAREPVVQFAGSPFEQRIDEPDNDGYHNNSISARYGHRFSEETSIDFSLLRAVGNTQYDSDGANEDDFKESALGATLKTTPLEFWDMQFSAGMSKDYRTSFRSGNSQIRNRFDTERYSASWQNDFYPSDEHTITTGVDYHDDHVESNFSYEETSRYTAAAFAQYRGVFGRNTVMARIRPLKDEQFGHETTGNIAWGYRLSGSVNLNVSYGTAFRAPTFNDLYFPGFGNPDLDPEKSRTYEAGINGNHSWGSWNLNAYHTKIDDLIIFSNTTFVPENVENAEIDGLEATIDTRILGWQARFSGDMIVPRNDTNNKWLPRRARRTLQIDIDRDIGKFGVGGTLLAQSRRFDDRENLIRVGSYSLLDLRAEYRFSRQWLIRARLENVLDTRYQTVDTYNMPRRSLFVSLHFNSR